MTLLKSVVHHHHPQSLDDARLQQKQTEAKWHEAEVRGQTCIHITCLTHKNVGVSQAQWRTQTELWQNERQSYTEVGKPVTEPMPTMTRAPILLQHTLASADHLIAEGFAHSDPGQPAYRAG